MNVLERCNGTAMLLRAVTLSFVLSSAVLSSVVLSSAVLSSVVLSSVVLSSFGAGRAAAQSGDTKVWAFVGTYTRDGSRGIYAVPFDTESGEFGSPHLAAESEHPSFLAIHPSGNFLYAVGEVGDYQAGDTGFVRSFRIDRASGDLTQLNTQSSGGSAPCHLVVDATGHTVLVANYSGGNVSSIAIKDDGRLGDTISLHQHAGSSGDSQRQKDPHAHSINLDSQNRFAYAADLGLDKVLIYRFDAPTGRLIRNGGPNDARVPPGSGPRHFAFHPSGKYAYVINELASTVVAFRADPLTGTLESMQTISTLPHDHSQPSYTADVAVHPNGRFVYGSNRGHDSIAVFRVDTGSGKLTRVQIEPTQGQAPRNFVIDPTGKFLLAENQGSSTVVVFRIDAQTGQLTPTGHVLDVPVPVCMRFLTND